MKKTVITIVAMAFAALPLSVQADWHEPYTRSRIFWDNATRKTVFKSGWYPRLTELADGRLMAVAESSGINYAFSTDKGNTWSESMKLVGNTNNVPNCVPDLIQLADGTIIVAYNPRPNSPYTEDRPYGIRCKRSTDNGKTWSDEINVYDAACYPEAGCWEPYMMQLPSGEVQLYYADEGPYTETTEQQISMCRSFDSGQTWSAPQKVSFRAGFRDGMPSAVLLHDGETIALAFEDNGWTNGGDFLPTIVTCPLSVNWHDYWADTSSEHRWQAVDYSFCTRYEGGAPYLRVLPWGETIISHQGTGNGISKSAMIVYVGDEDAKYFRGATMPFGTDNSLWNGLAVIDTGTVVAIGGMSGRSDMIKGRAIRQFQAPFSHPVVDGKQTLNEGYGFANATQMLLGHSSDKVRFTADFAYDNDSLYFTTRISDTTPHLLANSYGDGVTFFIDCNYASDKYPVDGIHRILFRRDGNMVCYKGQTAKNRWGTNTLPNVHYVVNSADRYYIVEAAIPWKDLGFASAPVTQKMRVNVMLQDNQDGGNVPVISMMPDAQRDASWTWMDFVLLEPDPTGVYDVKDNGNDISVKYDKGELRVSGNAVKTEIFSVDGRKLATYTENRFGAPAGDGIVILRITTDKGAVVTRKMLLV